MTRMGREVFEVLGEDGGYVPCVHTVGAPLEPDAINPEAGYFGVSPRYEDLDWRGLAFGRGDFEKITAIDKGQWQREFELHEALFRTLAQGLPHHLPQTKAALEKRLMV